MQPDVIVVGAGPTGLLLATELALAGARPLVLERLTAPDQTLKAGSFWALAGEALERRGLGDALDVEEARFAALLAERLGTAPLAAMKKIGGHFAGLFLIDQTRQREPERRMRGVSQQALERILGEHAAKLGVEVRRGVVVTGFAQDADGVSVRVGDETIRARYVVGCDGGRSNIRKLAGFEFPGTAPVITGYQVLVTLDHFDRLAPWGWRRTKTGVLAVGPAPGRVLMVEFIGPPADRDAPITNEEVEGAIRRVSGADVRVQSIQSATRFTDNARQADTYRKGRVLLAGDAAHVHSPFGGQGLNLGLLDAVNLGWKLGAVVRGERDELLDTYTAERHPIAARVLENTRAQVALMRPDEQTTALREVVTQIMATDAGNQFFGELISGVRQRYDVGSDDPRVGRLLGDRALFPLFRDGRAVLVGAELSVPVPPRVLRAAVKSALLADEEAMLVRPDGCIAWIGRDAAGLAAALTRWCGPP